MTSVMRMRTYLCSNKIENFILTLNERKSKIGLFKTINCSNMPTIKGSQTYRLSLTIKYFFNNILLHFVYNYCVNRLTHICLKPSH